MTYLAVVATVLCLTQGTPLDGSWELTRICRSGPSAAPRAVPLDSTVYVRLSLDSQYRRLVHGSVVPLLPRPSGTHQAERGTAARDGRWILSADFDHPVSMQAKAAAWLVGGTLRLGTPFVPDADSIALRRVRGEAPYPPTVLEVVTRS
jgi:hypothetical protein